MQKMTEGKPLYVGVDTVAVDFGVSRAKAYAIEYSSRSEPPFQ